jgi:chromosomal replication initiator protein
VSQAVTKEGWKRVQNVLCARIGQDRWDLHFKNTHIHQLDEGAVVVGVPSVMVADYLDNTFSRDVTESVKLALGFVPVHVKFTVDGSLFQKMRDGQRAAKAAVQLTEVEAETETTSKAPRPERIFALNAKYGLERFIVGPHARLAFDCAIEVAQFPRSGRHCPLFIHSRTGLGKTHLLQGIALRTEAIHPNARVLYVTGEYFFNMFLQAVRERRTEQFRQRFRSQDVLIVDDVQFLCGKEKGQDELLHTLKTMESGGQQVALAANLPPRELPGISEPLRSRFLQGVVADIEYPTELTRRSLIRSRVATARAQFPEATIQFLAESLECNVREIEGILHSLMTVAAVNQGARMTTGVVREALAGTLVKTIRTVDLRDIENAVIGLHGVTSEALHSRRRDRAVASARQLCMYLARRLTQHSLKEIGQHFGGKNHTTVVFSVQKIEAAMQTDSGMQAIVARLERQLTGRAPNNGA